MAKANENLADKRFNTGLLLLDVLEKYCRKGSPTKPEADWLSEQKGWSSTLSLADLGNNHRDKFNLDNQKSKLPFHPLLYGDPWGIISPEIDGKSVSRLLPLYKILNLCPDQFYVTAIENIAGSSRVCFQDVKALFSQIRNYELSLTTLKSVAGTLPLCHDKVLFLQHAVQTAAKWKKTDKSGGDDSEPSKAFEQLSKLHSKLSAELLLQQHNLNEIIFNDLISQPAELICQLYYLKSQQYLESKDDRLHDLVDEISSRSKLNPDKIRQYLIQKWLTDSSDEFKGSFEAGKDSGMPNQARVLYLLRKGNVDKNVSFLLNLSHQNSAKVPYLARFRAIQAVFSFATRNTVSKIYGKPIKELAEYMQTLLFLTRLYDVGVKQSFEEFKTADKASLAKGLWRNHNGNAAAVRLIADLCLDYEVYDVVLWNSVLSQLLKFPSFEYFKRILPRISAIGELSYLPFVKQAWNSILNTALERMAKTPFSEEDSQESLHCAEKTVDLLERCPFLHEIDMASFGDALVREGHIESGLRVLLLSESIEKCLSLVDKALDEGRGVSILGYLYSNSAEPSKKLAHVRDRVYDRLDKDGLYHQVVGTTHFPNFISYLIKEDRIDGLLQASLGAGRTTDAERLVQAYRSAYPDGAFAQYCTNAEVSEKDQMMRVYTNKTYMVNCKEH